MKNDLKIIKPWPLKPETPLKKRKEIRNLEREIDRLLLWRYWCVLALEMIIAAIVAVCVVHSHGLLLTM